MARQFDAGAIALAYPEDSATLFERIVDLPWPVFLDSCHPHYPQARYDILAADPACTVTTRGQSTCIETREGTEMSPADPFEVLKSVLNRESERASERVTHLPFTGGAIGYFGYDLGRRIERLAVQALDDLELPEMAMGIYRWAVVVDHLERRAWLAGEPDADVERLFTAPARRRRRRYSVHSALRSDSGREEYALAFAKIKEHIHDGDCYQVNLARRFSVAVTGHPFAVYRDLRRRNPAPFSAYLATPHAAILSVSPERFLEVRGSRVETRPIKGTRPRGPCAETDRMLAAELRASAKDRAENVMIVDLLRNDLGKTCEIGSVGVPELFSVESFPTVHHLVSTVTGRLAAGRHALDLLRGCFPGGSITGAPKVRAMEIIESLEPVRRGVYCGSIGYVGFDGDMDTNIGIRTLVYRDDRAYLWAGGGIVADSELDSEYEEIRHKVSAMLDLLRRPAPSDTAP